MSFVDKKSQKNRFRSKSRKLLENAKNITSYIKNPNLYEMRILIRKCDDLHSKTHYHCVWKFPYYPSPNELHFVTLNYINQMQYSYYLEQPKSMLENR